MKGMVIYIRLHRRIKRAVKQYIIVALICFIVLGGAALLTSVIILNQIRSEYKALIREGSTELEANRREVFSAVTNILPGEIITVAKLKNTAVYSSQGQELYMTKEDIGKQAAIAIPAGSQILKSMVTEYDISSGLREIELSGISANLKIEAGDSVDVRLTYPDGENYAVLTKKVIQGIKGDRSAIYLWLDEEELLRISSAMTDRDLYQGSGLYTAKYIVPEIEEASTVTYIPSLSILSLIDNNPNITDHLSKASDKDDRKALENRLAQNLKLKLPISAER